MPEETMGEFCDRLIRECESVRAALERANDRWLDAETGDDVMFWGVVISMLRIRYNAQRFLCDGE